MIDPEDLIRSVLPGGYSCDPQVIADNIRDYFKAAAQAPAEGDAIQRLIAAQARIAELRRALEVIAVGDSKDPVTDAGDELVALGYWDGDALAAARASDLKAQPKGTPVAWANFRHDPPSYVPFKTRELAQRSVEQSEISATQEGPYSVVALYASTNPSPSQDTSK